MDLSVFSALKAPGGDRVLSCNFRQNPFPLRRAHLSLLHFLKAAIQMSLEDVLLFDWAVTWSTARPMIVSVNCSASWANSTMICRRS
jgi:hypothetical protein